MVSLFTDCDIDSRNKNMCSFSTAILFTFLPTLQQSDTATIYDIYQGCGYSKFAMGHMSRSDSYTMGHFQNQRDIIIVRRKQKDFLKSGIYLLN